MKKSFVLGSLAVALMVAGCSQKGVEPSTGSQYTETEEKAVSVDRRIQIVEGNLRNIFFDFDQFVIRPDMQSVVSNNADVLTSEVFEGLTLRVEGNTDEWGTDEYNYALGLKRAVAAKDALVARGVAESKVVLVSYGESKPTCLEKTRECWAENRKVTFKVLP